MPGPGGPIYVAPAGFMGLNVPSRPAKSGETILIFGSGFGPTTPPITAGQIVHTPVPITDLSQLHVVIGGVSATVQYAGITFAGEFQLNIQLPALVDGDQPIMADIGGISMPPGLFIAIKN